MDTDDEKVGTKISQIPQIQNEIICAICEIFVLFSSFNLCASVPHLWQKSCYGPVSQGCFLNLAGVVPTCSRKARQK